MAVFGRLLSSKNGSAAVGSPFSGVSTFSPRHYILWCEGLYYATACGCHTRMAGGTNGFRVYSMRLPDRVIERGRELAESEGLKLSQWFRGVLQRATNVEAVAPPPPPPVEPVVEEPVEAPPKRVASSGRISI